MIEDTQRAFTGESQIEEPMSENHIEIDRAIQYQEEVVIRLECLINRIFPQTNTGQSGTGDEPSPLRTAPSLGEVLQYGPSRIRRNTDQAVELINKLESLLF